MIPSPLFVWTTHSTKPCPSCQKLQSTSLTMDEWNAMGILPGSDLLDCFPFCKCSLEPAPTPDGAPLPPSPEGEGAGGEVKPLWPVIVFGIMVSIFASIRHAREHDKPLYSPSPWEIIYDLIPDILKGEASRPEPFTPDLWKIIQQLLPKVLSAVHNPGEEIESAYQKERNPMPDIIQQHQIRLASSGAPNASGAFEVFAITAGDGNGWFFTPQCLQDSLPLWDNAQCFVDHSVFNHSVRDLAGTYSSPRYDPAAQGIILTLKPAGPSAALLEEVGRDILINQSHIPVGFSADISFTAIQNTVHSILKVHSVDLVLDPARGGQFLRTLNSKLTKGIIPMPEIESPPSPPAFEQERASMQALLDVTRQQQALAEQAEQARQTHASMCVYLLDSGLAASRLPQPMQDQVRKQFSGQVFTAAQLQTAIDDARQLVSDLTGSLTVSGPGRIHAMFNEADKLQAAVDDMFNVPRSPEHATLSTPRLSGIRELYMTLTGDLDLHGGYFPDRVQLATTADFTGLVKNALNKTVINTWEMLGKAGYTWWNNIATVEHFNSLNTITGTLIGTVGALPEVAEGAEYTELLVGDSPETATFKKYGGYIPLTLELIDRDETRKLQAYSRELASAGLRKISALVAAIFTDNAGIGPTLADTGALFNATAVTTAGGHKNLLTTALASAEWEVVSQAMYEQPMLIKNAVGLYGTGPRMAISPRFCLVPRKLQLTASEILYPTLKNATSIYSENLQRGQPGDVITVPEWTDTTDWAAVADPAIAPAIFIGERFGLMPEIFVAGENLSPAVFTNDEHRLKVRHFMAVWVNDFRPLHKSNVAG